MACYASHSHRILHGCACNGGQQDIHLRLRFRYLASSTVNQRTDIIFLSGLVLHAPSRVIHTFHFNTKWSSNTSSNNCYLVQKHLFASKTFFK